MARRRRRSAIILAVLLAAVAFAVAVTVLSQRRLEGAVPGNAAVLSLAVTDDFLLVATSEGIYASRGGINWAPHALGEGTSLVASQGGAAFASVDEDVFRVTPRADFEKLVSLNDPPSALAATAQGVFAISGASGTIQLAPGGTVEDLGANRPGGITAFAVSADPNFFLAASPSDGLWRFTEEGANWQRLLGTPSSAVLIDPATPRRFLLGTAGGLLISQDAGLNWNFTQLRESVVALAFNDETYYAVSSRLVYSSPDGFSKWTPLVANN